MSLRFLHLADLHLDSPFKAVSTVSQHLSSQMKQATRTSFERLVSQAIQKKVDAVLIAGDAFNATRPSVSAQLFFSQQLERLVQAGIAVFLAYGNHDYYRGSLLVDLPDQVQVFDQAVTSFSLTGQSGESALVSGFSYHSSHIYDSPLGAFSPKGPEDFHIGVYHGQVSSGRQGHGYAPFNLAEMNALGYDYWALGHIHQAQVLQEQPPIAYSGSIQGLDRSEVGSKGGLLVTLTKGQFAQVEPLYTAPLIWQALDLPLQEGDSLMDLKARLKASLSQGSLSQGSEKDLVSINWQVAAGVPEEQLDQLRQIDAQDALSEASFFVYKQTFHRQTPVSQLSLDPDKQALFEGLGQEGLPQVEVETALKPLLKHKTIQLFKGDLVDESLFREIEDLALEGLKMIVGVSNED